MPLPVCLELAQGANGSLLMPASRRLRLLEGSAQAVALGVALAQHHDDRFVVPLQHLELLRRHGAHVGEASKLERAAPPRKAPIKSGSPAQAASRRRALTELN